MSEYRGIWLHSTNDETRIDKGLDSRGCVVAANNDLKEIAQFVELDKTNIVIVHDASTQFLVPSSRAETGYRPRVSSRSWCASSLFPSHDTVLFDFTSKTFSRTGLSPTMAALSRAFR